MSLRISITRSAEKDLRGIWSYTLTRTDVDIADRVVEEIRAELKKLAEMPRMGHRRPDIKNPRYRVWSVYSYLIVYRITRKSVSVSRIVSGRRDISRIFRRKRR